MLMPIYFAGEVLFKLHSDDLKIELENVLYDLVRERLPQWKQMRGLEVISAIIAETLIEMGVLIFCEPPAVHWPNGLVSKLAAAAARSKKRGKNVQKQKQGIYGELVSTLAPTIPQQKENAPASKVVKKATKGGKFKTPLKEVITSNVQKEPSDNTSAAVDTISGAAGDSTDVHQGLPAR